MRSCLTWVLSGGVRLLDGHGLLLITQLFLIESADSGIVVLSCACSPTNLCRQGDHSVAYIMYRQIRIYKSSSTTVDALGASGPTYALLRSTGRWHPHSSPRSVRISQLFWYVGRIWLTVRMHHEFFFSGSRNPSSQLPWQICKRHRREGWFPNQLESWLLGYSLIKSSRR